MLHKSKLKHTNNWMPQ